VPIVDGHRLELTMNFFHTRWASLLLALLCMLFAGSAAAQRRHVVVAPAAPPPPPPDTPSGDDGGPVQRPPSSAPSDPNGPLEQVVVPSESGTAPAVPAEIFPLASELNVYLVGLEVSDATRIDAARHGHGWYCSDNPTKCRVSRGPAGGGQRDSVLRAAVARSPALPTVIPVWSVDHKPRYNPELLDLSRPAAFRLDAIKPQPDAKPDTSPAAGAPPAQPAPPDAPAPPAPPATKHEEATPPAATPVITQMAEMNPPPPTPAVKVLASFRWPTASDETAFQYVAVANDCGQAVVTRYTRDFEIPIQVMGGGQCDRHSPGFLQVANTGSLLRVSAFNLDQPPRGQALSVTYRVETPDLTDTTRTKMLLPDILAQDLVFDCSGTTAPPPRSQELTLAESTIVVSPMPLLTGRCRIRLLGDLPKRARTATLALRVILQFTDHLPLPNEFPANTVFRISERSVVLPAVPIGEETRLRVSVVSDPANPMSTAVLLSDAVRYPQSADQGAVDPVPFMRTIAASTILAAPLCGPEKPVPLEQATSCLRVYVTVPLTVVSAQITRAPWVESPLVTANALPAIGAALAGDLFDPNRQRPFPLSLQLGIQYERLTSSKNGVTGYIGIEPRLPVLTQGHWTASIGLLAGVGTTYVIDSAGPNEGFKPTAFLAVVSEFGTFTLNGGKGSDRGGGGGDY
jgi:hypothetical protein